jgi:hypothetical protein
VIVITKSINRSFLALASHDYDINFAYNISMKTIEICDQDGFILSIVGCIDNEVLCSAYKE